MTQNNINNYFHFQKTVKEQLKFRQTCSKESAQIHHYILYKKRGTYGYRSFYFVWNLAYINVFDERTKYDSTTP